MSCNAETCAIIRESSQTLPVGRARRSKAGIAQYPVQILIPAETRDALRQRSADTGASIRHIILRSLAADGFPVPKGNRQVRRLS
jgi:hypothetical protein